MFNYLHFIIIVLVFLDLKRLIVMMKFSCLFLWFKLNWIELSFCDSSLCSSMGWSLRVQTVRFFIVGGLCYGTPGSYHGTDELQQSWCSTLNLWHYPEYSEQSATLFHYKLFPGDFNCVNRIKCCQTRLLNWIAVMGSKRWKKRPLKGSCPSLLERMETRKILTQVRQS